MFHTPLEIRKHRIDHIALPASGHSIQYRIIVTNIFSLPLALRLHHMRSLACKLGAIDFGCLKHVGRGGVSGFFSPGRPESGTPVTRFQPTNARLDKTTLSRSATEPLDIVVCF